MSVSLHVNFADDPKVAGLTDAAFRLLVESLCDVATQSEETDWYSGERYPTDFVPWCFVAAREALHAADELVAAGVWTVRDWEEQPGFGIPAEGVWWRFRATRRVLLRLWRRHIPDTVRASVYARDGHQCVMCGRTDSLSLDHIHPHSRGGTDDPNNLQTMCRPCNSRKGARV